ncbi:MAG: recombinase RecT [Candidatus Hydrogenedentes bacterium]|nr:recombinase RecT [Candidatus Hydrogenedentota bacterium]
MGAENLPAKTEEAPLTQAEITGAVGGWGTMAKVLAAKHGEMSRVVNAALTPEKLTQLTLTAMKNAKTASKILQCTGLSVAKTFMDLAMTGLSPAPQLGLVCFVPYGKDLQLQIEYRGFIALAKRSGQVSYITADVVREGDDFAYERGTEQFLRHVPKGVGEATHYYALVRFKDGSSDFRVMTKAQVEKHRDKFSKQYMATKRGTWKDHFDAMAMKTCIRLLCKLLDLSPEMTHAARLDEYNEAGVGARSLDMNKPGRSGLDLSPRRIESESVPADDAKAAQSDTGEHEREPDESRAASSDMPSDADLRASGFDE